MFTPYATKKPRGIAPVGMVIDKSCRVYITNIPLERIEREGSNALFKEFEALGPIDSYKMFTDKSGRFLGSALCTYRNPADAAACVTKMNNAIVGATTVTLATAGEGNEEGSLASDGSPNALPLKVTQARDHGVVLLHQSLDRGFDPSSTQNVNITPRNAPYSKPTAQADSADEAGGMKPSSTAGSRANPNDRWTHDKYERLFQHAHVDGLDDSEMPRGGGVEDWAEDDDVYSGGVSRNVRHPRRSLATRGRGRHARDGGPRRFREERGHGDSTLSSYSSGRRKERPLRGAEIDAAFESYVTQRDEMLGLGAIQARAIPVAALPLTEDERPAVPVPPSGVSPPEPQVGDAPSS